MSRIGRTVSRHLQRASGAEQFVQLVVGGGIALVAGLWALELAAVWSAPWLLGISLALLGVAGLGYGIWSQIEYERP
jgi:hypothetical protein